MISKEFVVETDKIIAQITARKITLENGNVLIARAKLENKVGSIFISDDAVKKDSYHNGFGRVIAVAPMTPDAVAEIKPGNYVMFSHEARYKPFTKALRAILGELVEEDMFFSIARPDIILQQDGDVLNKV